MSVPAALCPTTCDIYRPLAAGSPLATGVVCQLVCELTAGRPAGAGGLQWSHYLVVNPSVDLRDGCTRAAGANALTYADGDGVVIPSGAGNTRYVVVWVETVQRGTPGEHKRAYLLRDQAAWPGP